MQRVDMKLTVSHLIFCFFSELKCFRQIDQIFSQIQKNNISKLTFP